MMRKLKRWCLLALTMAPITAVSFAAKAALNVAQIGKHGVSDHDLARTPYDSAS